jgi:O-antigen ligase
MTMHRVIDARASPSLLPLVGLGVYFVTSILYVFPSGSPQPADFLLVLAIVATLLVAWRRLPNESGLYIALGLFVTWIVLVNIFWYFIDPDFLFLKRTSFYLYNSFVFWFVVAAGYHDWKRLKLVIWWSCVIALLAQLFYLEFLYHAIDKRATGTFNNPNQLGYWALLLMACLAVAKERAPLGVLDLLALGAGYYTVMLSLSKAASISGMLLILLIMAFCRLQRISGQMLGAALVLGLVFELANGGLIERFMSFEAVANLEHRLDGIGTQRDDDLMGRGYIRLIQHPEYLAFGAGEKKFEREGEAVTKETHSSIGTILVSYGLIGFGLFGLLLFVIFVRAPLASTAYFGPIMLFSITHMGLRDSIFWVFLGLVYAQARYGTWGPSTTSSTTGSARLPRW